MPYLAQCAVAVCMHASRGAPYSSRHPSLVRSKPDHFAAWSSFLRSRSLAARHRRARQPRRRRPARRRQRARPWPPRRSRCAALRSLSEHILQAAAAFSRGAATSCARGLCVSRVGSVQFGSFFCVADASDKGSPRDGQCLLTCCWLSLLFAAAGCLRASMLCLLLCGLHLLCLLRWLIFALSPGSFSRSLSLLSCLARSQRRGHLQCAT